MTRRKTIPTSSPEPKRYVLRLYNAGRSAEGEALARQFEEAVRRVCGDSCEVEHVDVLTEPERALQQEIYATPTLIKELPEPARRVIGDLSNPEEVLLLLGIVATKPDDKEDGSTER